MGDKIVSAQRTAKPVKTRFGEFKTQSKKILEYSSLTSIKAGDFGSVRTRMISNFIPQICQKKHRVADFARKTCSEILRTANCYQNSRQEMFPQNCSIFVPYHGAFFEVFFEI